jgi:hypothetical protein
MTASTAPFPSARAALGALVDYAGLFPPAALSLAEAVSEYGSERGGPHAWMLGRFIIGAEQLAHSADAVGLPIAAIVEPDAASLGRAGELRARGARIESLEIPIGKAVSPFRDRLSPDEVLDVMGALETDLVAARLRDLPACVEIPWTPPWIDALSATFDALARFGLGAKMRCGGVTAQAFPSVEQVAGFIAEAGRTGVPFKATAGLHHPIRHRDAATGFTMHGFLNVLVAAALAESLERAAVAAIVAEEEPRAFTFAHDAIVWRDQRVDLTAIAHARRNAFVGFGSCSFREPVEDLIALGVLPQ